MYVHSFSHLFASGFLVISETEKTFPESRLQGVLEGLELQR